MRLGNVFMLVVGKAKSKFNREGSETKSRGLICKEHDAGLSDELSTADNHAALEQEPGAGQHPS